MTPPIQLEDELPLTEATFFILLSLAPEPKHGYAIMKDVEGLSESRVRLSTSTLYGAIKRLLDKGWIRRIESEAGDQDGRERKYYQLTRLGRRILEAEAERLEHLVAVARLRAAEERA
jgi:DNA-binding PadR family transcriptional regulator